MRRRAIAIAVLLASFGVTASYLKPSRLMADARPADKIATAAAVTFAGWRSLGDVGQVVNPQANALLNKLYAETVNLRYADENGQVIMLAIAYGRDQSDTLAVHEPMVCYPSQGFKVKDHRIDQIDTPWGGIPVQRLVATFGPQRVEPVTYWTTLGDRTVGHQTLAKKRLKFDYSLQGLVPDGLLFRVSSLDPDPEKAYALQDRFVREYLAQLTPDWRRRLAGL